MTGRRGRIIGNENHLQDVRIFDVYKSLICKQCNKSFDKKTSFQAHVKSHEFDDHTYESKNTPLDKNRPYMCNICGKRFTAKKNLLKHLRVIHKNLNEAEKLKVKKTRCPEANCLFACRKMRDLRNHIEKQHEIKILKDTLQFKDEDDFLRWKKEEEDNSVSSFVALRRKGMLRNGTMKKVLLCHRTGQYSPKGTGKHRLKSHGSCKIGGTCPAAMEIVQCPNGEISVCYYKTHLGHSQDVIHLQLSREDREKLSERIKQGFSLDAILEDVKESFDPVNGKKKRIHLLSRKDLYNIMQSCNNKKLKNESEVDGLSLKDQAISGSLNEMNECENMCEFSDKGTMSGKTAVVVRKSDLNHFAVSDKANYDIIQTVNADPILFQNETAVETSACDETLSKTTPQLLIVSPSVNYRSVAEVILLQPTETVTHDAAKSPQIVTNISAGPMSKRKDVTTKGKAAKDGKMEKKRVTKPETQSPLTAKLQNKLEKLSTILPRSEFLTPKQYEIVEKKLDSIINILNNVSVKPKSKKLNIKKSESKETGAESLQEDGNLEIECVLAAPQNVVQQQVYETPLYAYVCNYN